MVARIIDVSFPLSYGDQGGRVEFRIRWNLDSVYGQGGHSWERR